MLPADGSLVENVIGGLGSSGGAGASTDPLALGSTLATVQGIAKSSPEAAPKAAEAEDLIGQLTATVAGMPAGAPVDLTSLPVGVDLMGVLESLEEFAVEGPPVSVTFNVDPAKSEGIRNPIGLIAPEGADGFPYMDSEGAFFGEKTIQLTEPGLYAFADSVAPVHARRGRGRRPAHAGSRTSARSWWSTASPSAVPSNARHHPAAGAKLLHHHQPEQLAAVQRHQGGVLEPGPAAGPDPAVRRRPARRLLIPNLDALLRREVPATRGRCPR